jgi:hypothetical protein
MIDAITQRLMSEFREGGITGDPCDEWQIQDLEQEFGVKFPVAYKAFLLIAGHGCTALQGSHHAIDDDLAECQRSGKRIMERDGGKFPTGVFVFLVHQGFVCNFFVLDDGDDPPVYECVDRPPARQVSRHFSEWLLGNVTRK